MVNINQDETLDDLIIQGLQIIQKRKGFRLTLDSVLLAHFVSVKEGDRVIDLGTGTGVIPLILSTRAKKIAITGIEIQEEMVEMAARSVLLNGREESITIHRGDIRDIHNELGGGIYTVVCANPPYWTMGGGEVNVRPELALARHEVACALEDVVSSASKLLNYQGRFALIHRVERLVDLFALLRQYRLEPRRIRLIHSFRDKAAHLVLVEARKSAPPDLKALPPLIIYEKPGCFTSEILSWYGKEGGSVG